MAARTGYAHVPKVTSQIKFISCIYNPTHLYGRESQRPNQRWKTLQLNPVRRTPLGRSFWSRIRHGFYGSFPARDSISAGVGHHSGRPRPNHRLRRALQVSQQTPCFGPWMIFCCNAMRGEMTTADSLIFDDAKETLLTVNFRLPRKQRSVSPKIK